VPTKVRSVPARKKRGEERSDGATDVRVPVGKPGNSKGDQAWLAEQVKSGLIRPVEEGDTDVAFGALLMFTGTPGEDESYWKLPPEGRRCTGHSRIRDEEGRYIVDTNGDVLLRPCAKWTILGGKVCATHGGGVETVKAMAKLRLVSAADSLVGALISIALDTKTDAKARVQAINSALDRVGISGTINISAEIPKYKEMLNQMFSDEWGSTE
jgi:hypothetical protein